MISRGSRFLPAILLFLIAAGALPARAVSPEEWNVQWEPADLVNGSPVLFLIRAPQGLRELRGNFLGQGVSFRMGQACHCWYGIAGVSLSTQPGQYTLRLEGISASPEKATLAHVVPVGAAHYPATTIKVAPQFVAPPKETLARIEEDQAIKKQAFATTLPEALWLGRFQPPAQAEVSGVFGSARVFNGVKKSQHTGIDFRVTTGTPIHATNAGTVVLARSLYFEGNCVTLDHGQGLMSLYMHLSEIKVKEGDKVEAGQLVGLSGGTGRATAPHLHFALRWHGEYLDPGTLLQLNPPQN